MSVDLTSLFSLVLQWVFYPIIHWSFSFAGITMSMSDFFLGCIILALVITVLKYLAGNPKLKFINLIFGGE